MDIHDTFTHFKNFNERINNSQYLTEESQPANITDQTGPLDYEITLKEVELAIDRLKFKQDDHVDREVGLGLIDFQE